MFQIKYPAASFELCILKLYFKFWIIISWRW